MGPLWYYCLLGAHILWKVVLADEVVGGNSGLVVKIHGLPPGSKQLQHMILDERTGNVIIGATNTIFIRDSELNFVKRISIGPHNDSIDCPPNPEENCQCVYSAEAEGNITVMAEEGCGHSVRRELTDSIVKNLVLNSDLEELIVCTNLYYGYCSKVSLVTDTVEQVFRPIVSNSLTGESVVLIAKSANIPNALYVGATRDTEEEGKPLYKDQSHMLAVRNLDDFDIAHIDDITNSVSLLDVKQELRDKFPINFKYTFSYNKYSYFLFNRRTSQTTNNTGTFIARICQDDPKMQSYVEFQIECEDANSQSYNSILSADIIQVGTDLAIDLQLTPDDMVLFGLFGVTLSESFTVASDQTQLCVYSVRSIESRFTEAVRFCFSGIGATTGPDHLTEPKKCKSLEFQQCGMSTDNWPIMGRRSIKPKTKYQFSGDRLTSLAVKRTKDKKYTVGYLGNKVGQLKKVTFESKRSMQEFGVQTLGQDGKAVMRDMFFDATRTYLYAMNDQQVFKVQLFDCSIYTDCRSCIEANEPQCGWCIFENRCTEKVSCELGDQSFGWRSYLYPTCHAISETTPSQIAVDEVSQTEVVLKMHTDISEIAIFPLQCELSYNEFSETSDTIDILGGVNCTPFSASPEFPADQSVDTIEPDIWIRVMEKRWIKKTITIFDCSRRTSCSSCVSGDLPCLWCSLTNQCQHSRKECHNSSAIISPTVNDLFSSADLVGADHCPRVLPVAGHDYLVSSGSENAVKVEAKALIDYHTKGLRCRFEFGEGEIVEATYHDTDKTISCEPTTLAYEEEVGSIDIPVEFYWEENKLLDNPDNITVSVYRCEHLADTCGECTLLAEQYRCGWCEDRCTLPEFCVSPSDSKLLTRDQICPNPQITKFYPTSGPILGGTNVTIEGVNLGKRLSDVKGNVQIAGVQCEVYAELFEPPNRLVCSAGSANFDRSGSVKIVVGGNDEFTATSDDSFNYIDPVLVQFEPQKGPVSGGTVVTISGQYLDMGSQVTVSINSRRCKLLRRESSFLEFETSGQPAAINERIVLVFDGTKENRLAETFAFIEDPRITSVSPEVAILSGGSSVVVNGSYLDSAADPVFYVEVDGTHSESTCEVVSKRSLECPLADLSVFDLDPSFEDPANLSYGFRVDGWLADLNQLSYDLDLTFNPIKLFPDPIVHFFTDTDGIKPILTGSRTFEILGEHLEILEKVPGLAVKVGNTSCEIRQVSPDVVIAVSPENPDIINEDGNSKVEVILGGFRQTVGYIQYSSPQSSKAGLVVGILLGVILTLIVVGLVVWVLRRKKRRKKHASPIHLCKDNGTTERANIYAGAAGANNIEVGESVPLKDMAGGPGGASGGPEDEEEDDEPDSDKPFELTDFLDRIRDPKLRAHVEEVTVPSERLDMQDMIGRGNFGCVYMAELKETEEENACRVAVKTLQGERLEQHTVEAFLKEGVIMKNFNHPHVLRLLGVCVNKQENPMVILPYMANGDLRSYVKDKKKNFTARQLLHLAQQVAEGMTYLSGLNFVHRDLAARNCMIDEFDVVKVADFGLTRDLFEKQYFSTNLKEKRGKMPIKWMALESLEEFVFTTQSDVWSFGVLMWELMTRGVTPYPDVDIFDVRNYLASGRRLRKPKYCPDNIYNIMLACWHADPDIRPVFVDLVNRLEVLLNPPKRRLVSEDENSEPMYMNIRKTNSTEYLKPLDGSTSEELLGQPRA